ncbi:hypothetical protein GYN07_29545 (plasmid) [Rhizobium leguminosarum bv. viciae 248]|uniref:hypothetical protein n=1 Tax=Rhizobium leguminosarum TaxID=384 RepID=UPI00037CAF79|nr:hypothetical protein [Rhizobium leguminosarum]MCA2407030.1 hypothetical protein [Rhizobium leguminosarum]NKM60733.1 hypothetical protein [Rhizobium leguminosarum bv. viciae]QHW28467.1 hypothetical protein GYN07_29545 [Rhizobium leguminosarum bv. viciae 248]
MPDDLRKLSGVLDSNLKSTLENKTSFGGVDYFLVAQDGEDESALSLVKTEQGNTSLVTAEAIPGDPGLRAVPREVLNALLPGIDFEVPRDGPEPAVDLDLRWTWEELLSLLFDKAQSKVGSPEMNSRDNSPPATNHGRLACAWAVNKITTMALGKPVGGGLSTASMYQALKARDVVFDEVQLLPGLVIISPTTGSNVGHVGITGEDDKIYSNSSSEGMWLQNRTLKSWSDYYHVKKGLPILFYQLNTNRFSRAAIS